MNQMPSECPICGGEVVIQRFQCRACDVSIEGRFARSAASDFEEGQLPVLKRLARLSPTQLQFIEAFIRSEGKFNQLKEEVGLSYPTLRSRLDEVIRDLGFEPRPPAPEVDRTQVLADLREGKIDADEAARLLRGEG